MKFKIMKSYFKTRLLYQYFDVRYCLIVGLILSPLLLSSQNDTICDFDLIHQQRIDQHRQYRRNVDEIDSVLYELAITKLNRPEKKGESNDADFAINDSGLQRLSTGNPSASSRLKLYPNPVQDLLIIEGGQFATAQIEFLTFDGKILSSLELEAESNNRLTTRVPDLTPGLYYIRIYSKSGVSHHAIIKS